MHNIRPYKWQGCYIGFFTIGIKIKTFFHFVFHGTTFFITDHLQVITAFFKKGRLSERITLVVVVAIQASSQVEGQCCCCWPNVNSDWKIKDTHTHTHRSQGFISFRQSKKTYYTEIILFYNDNNKNNNEGNENDDEKGNLEMVANNSQTNAEETNNDLSETP